MIEQSIGLKDNGETSNNTPLNNNDTLDMKQRREQSARELGISYKESLTMSAKQLEQKIAEKNDPTLLHTRLFLEANSRANAEGSEALDAVNHMTSDTPESVPTAIDPIDDPTKVMDVPSLETEPQYADFKEWLMANPLANIARTKLGIIMSGASALAFKEKKYSLAADKKAEKKYVQAFAAKVLGAAGVATVLMATWKVTGAGASEIADNIPTGSTGVSHMDRIEATASLSDSTGGASYDPTAETGGASYDPTAATGETGQTGGTGSTGSTESTGGASLPPYGDLDAEKANPSLAVFGELDVNNKKSSTSEFASHYSDKNHTGNKVNAWGTERGIEDAEFGTFKGETLKDYLDTHSRITAGNVEVLVNARFQEKYGLSADTFNSEWGQNKREEMKREYISDSGHSLSEAGQRAHKYHMQELSEGKVVKMTASEAASKYGLTVNSYMTEGKLKGGIDDIATAKGIVNDTVLVTLDDKGKPKFAEKAACGNNIFFGNPDAPTPSTPNTPPTTDTPPEVPPEPPTPEEPPIDDDKKPEEAAEGHDNGENLAPKGDKTTDQDLGGNTPNGNPTNPAPLPTNPEHEAAPAPDPNSQPGTAPTGPSK